MRGWWAVEVAARWRFEGDERAGTRGEARTKRHEWARKRHLDADEAVNLSEVVLQGERKVNRCRQRKEKRG